MSMDFPNRAAVEAATIDPMAIKAIYVAGVDAVGDGGERWYLYSASDPGTDGKLQSDDGAWWIPVASPSYVATRAAMAARRVIAAGDIVHLVEGAVLGTSGRSGPFIATMTNISVQVAADPEQGWFVAFAVDLTGASGGWCRVRQTDYEYQVAHFGATPGQDIKVPLQAAINLAQFYASPTYPTELNTSKVFCPGGRYPISAACIVSSHAIVISGGGSSLCVLDGSSSSTGVLRFISPTANKGTFLHRVGLEDIYITSNAHVFSETDVGVQFFLPRHWHVRNVRIQNFSRGLEIYAGQQPGWISGCNFWQDNDLLTGNQADHLRLLAMPVDADATGHVDIDPDTGAYSVHGNMVFIKKNFFRSAANWLRSDIFIETYDGVKARGNYLGNAKFQLYVSVPGASSPVSNTDFAGNFFDGDAGTGGTDYNVYIRSKTYTSINPTIRIRLRDNKYDGSNISAIACRNMDVDEFELTGGNITKSRGTHSIDIIGGRGRLNIKGVQIVMGSANVAPIRLDARQVSFFKTAVLQSILFQHNGEESTLPAEMILIEGDGGNAPDINLIGNSYPAFVTLPSNATSTSANGLVKNNDAGATVKLRCSGNLCMTAPIGPKIVTDNANVQIAGDTDANDIIDAAVLTTASNLTLLTTRCKPGDRRTIRCNTTGGYARNVRRVDGTLLKAMLAGTSAELIYENDNWALLKTGTL